MKGLLGSTVWIFYNFCGVVHSNSILGYIFRNHASSSDHNSCCRWTFLRMVTLAPTQISSSRMIGNFVLVAWSSENSLLFHDPSPISLFLDLSERPFPWWSLPAEGILHSGKNYFRSIWWDLPWVCNRFDQRFSTKRYILKSGCIVDYCSLSLQQRSLEL